MISIGKKPDQAAGGVYLFPGRAALIRHSSSLIVCCLNLFHQLTFFVLPSEVAWRHTGSLFKYPVKRDRIQVPGFFSYGLHRQ